ncbi:MAG: alpha/beta fold hydrolase [Pseudomonadota bacterium]
MKAQWLWVMMFTGLVHAASGAQAGTIVEHQGRWLGDMTLPDGKVLKIGVELMVRADGSAWASFASPDQAAYDMPVKGIVESPHKVDLDLGMATLGLTWSNDHFEGAYAQNGPPLHFALNKVGDFPRRLLPQAPRAPFPYRELALAIPAGGGVVLGATLSMPLDREKPNVVVLVAGSGPVARDGGVAGHQAFLVMADHLARRGIAVLRYDKRGVARSNGNYEQHTVAQLASDVHAALEALRKSGKFARIGVVGISEGPGLAAAVGARDPAALDFVVSLAGVGLNGLELLLLQDRIYARDKGATPDEVQRLMPYVRTWYERVLAHADVEPRVAALKALSASLSGADQALVQKYEMNQGTLSLGWAAQPALRASLQSDPAPDWRALKVPVLALHGGLDHQVPAEENQCAILAALKAGGNTHVEAARLPSLNHLLQSASSGADDEYFRIEETMAPAVLRAIAAFVEKQGSLAPSDSARESASSLLCSGWPGHG